MANIRAELPDGRVLEFPEGTSQDVIDRTVKTELGVKAEPEALRGLALGLQRPFDILGMRAEQLPVVGPALQAGSRALGMPTATEVYQRAEAERLANPQTGQQLVGEIAGLLPLLPAALRSPQTMAQTLGGGAAGGAIMSTAQTPGEFIGDVGISAAAAPLLKGATEAIGGVIAPRANAAAQYLKEAGIDLTPGQIARQGSGLLAKGISAIEDAATSIPGIGDIINYARSGTTDDFERYAVDKTASFIGKTAPKDLTGRDAVSWVGKQLSDAYNEVVPKLDVTLDRDFLQRTSQIFKDLKIPSTKVKAAKEFTSIIKDNIVDMADKAGRISGKNLQDAFSTLGGLADDYLKSTDPMERRIGRGLNNVKTEMFDWFSRQNPDFAPQLKQINSGWAHLSRLKEAVRYGEGRVTPASLAKGVRAADTSRSDWASSQGLTPFSELTNKASGVIPSKLPDSGTARRALTATIVGGGLSSGGVAGANALGMETPLTPQQAALIPLVLSPYTPAGRKMITKLLARKPSAAAKAVGGAVRAAGSPVTSSILFQRPKQ